MEDNWENKLASKKDIAIYFCISTFYLTVSAFCCADSSYDIEIFIYEIIFILLLYLPEILIFILNFIIKKFEIKNPFIIKLFKVLIHTFSFIYFILLTLLMFLLVDFVLNFDLKGGFG